GTVVLHEPFAVTAGHADGYRAGMRSPRHRGNQRQSRIAENLRFPGQSERPRGGEADAYAREAARSERDDDALGAAFVRQFGNHRDKSFGVAAAEDLEGAGDESHILEQRG